jgi:CIC family chloride channel protein
MGAETMGKRHSSYVLNGSGFRRYKLFARKGLAANYSRELYKWLIISPIIGVVVGFVVTGITIIILDKLWPRLLHLFLLHHWTILPGLMTGFILAGLIMQYFTPDPNEHSTEEIVRSYHEHQGDIQMRPFFPKLLAAIATVGLGGSAALEGPSIYAGGALGSWLWAKLRRFGIEPRDRRIMLISGAAAGMGAVFRAPLTGLVFAIEMPYKDDLAHEALLPSLISSVVAYATLTWFVGSRTLFDFAGGTSYTRRDLLWAALLGLVCGLGAMVFVVVFRRVRSWAARARAPHWAKLAAGGFLTGLCGLGFVSWYHGSLIPLGPNYEAVGQILAQRHGAVELLVFGILKLAGALFSIGFGGVSAIFVPLFLGGGSFGVAFGQSIVHSPALGLYAAVGMAAFLAAGYKAPLTAVVFVAEATGGHGYIIPTLIGAAVAYAVSGEVSASGEQRVHESARVQELARIPVRQIMQRNVISVQANSTLQEFADRIAGDHPHSVFPVFQDGQISGTVSVRSLTKVLPEKWGRTTIREVMDADIIKVAADCDAVEALRLLTGQKRRRLILVVSQTDQLEGVVGKTDILAALDAARNSAGSRKTHRPQPEAEPATSPPM